ncbi:bifunctional 2-polyprenyl-6-hydroxyphenol methylase/3-demethylubiquinol 3-O-methyltransferase UbiG [Actinoplanes sp. N902-109]|uniref:class I SAM-dependent methyltransferase n=1 Tax=Actinoplanes sp. (strain N902-109) TaxID=649831 RepID=UPI0003294535|nr:class I SAM-dependent methyltransferase [Actinoplanes sp. N902-109]AGL17531.1 type 12 methyltransferase [Actinoplanes sp. N902-109]
MHDEQSWDARYAESDRIWSGEPNAALVHEIAGLTPGTALELGCGEGADAIWLARQGWTVTAADISGVAVERAARFAAAAGVSVDFQRHDLAVSFPAGAFDLVTASFLYSQGDFPREAVLRRAAAAVAPGGVLLIESHQDHGAYAATHGPMRFPSPAELIADLELEPGQWEVLHAGTHDRMQLGPDGTPGPRVDGTVKLRRR